MYQHELLKKKVNLTVINYKYFSKSKVINFYNDLKGLIKGYSQKTKDWPTEGIKIKTMYVKLSQQTKLKDS